MLRRASWLQSFDMSSAFLLMTFVSLALMGVRLARTPFRLAREWWGAMALVAAIAIVAQLLAPADGGYLAFGALLVVIIVPLQLDRAAQRAARAGEDACAQRWAMAARVLHPIGLVGRRGRALSAMARLSTGGALDDRMLKELGAEGEPLLTEWYRLNALHAAANVREIREALAQPSRRARMLQLGFGAAWVRAVASTGSLADVVDAVREAERLDATLVDPERRAQLTLEACAGLGDVEGTRAIVSTLGKRLPRGVGDFSIASAQRVAGDERGARETITRALASDVHPRARKLLERALQTPAAETEAAPIEPPRRSAEADALLARLRTEAVAAAVLAPLSGQSSSFPILTYALGALLCIAFVVLEATGGSTDEAHLRACGALIVPMKLHEAWRLFSATLLHAGVVHIAMNVVALIVFGRFVEAFYGKLRFVAIWLATTLVSGLAVVVVDRPATLVGASGAIFGLAGAVVAAVAMRRELRTSRRGREELRRLGLVFGLQIVFDNLVPNVSGTAHLGGLIGGALIGALLVPRAATTTTTT